MDSTQAIEHALGQISGGRVLDVATGVGTCIQWMIEDLKDYDSFIGIDARPLPDGESGTVFDREDVQFMPMDAHQIIFDDTEFDTVTMANSLHHMRSPAQVLREIRRVLKPGGHCIITEMVSDNLTEAQQTHKLIHHWWAEVDRALGIPHNETFTRAALVEMLNGLNLYNVQFFDHAALASDPHEPERIDFLKRRIAQSLERAQDLPDFADIQARGEAIAQRLDEVGFHPATALILIGQRNTSL